jgi:hypothetical protein
MTGRRAARPASTCYALTCICPTSLTLAQILPSRSDLAFQASQRVRHTVIRVVTAHLQEEAAVSWQGLDLDFTGVVFDGGDSSGARFSGGQVSFVDAEFSGGEIGFSHAEFSGARVCFGGARFSGGPVYFTDARFCGGSVTFAEARTSPRP